MENDKPISLLSEDRLYRKTFVQALASEISNIKDKDCSVIGLYGKWGAGKTSIIKLLDEELKNKYFFTAYFNPWRYKSEDILLKELFIKILEGVKSDKKLESNIEELGKLFEDYSQYISLPKVSFMGLEVDLTNPAKGVSKTIGTLLKGNDSFDSKKDKINNVLKNVALPLVIFIDDVDRLDTFEIQSLFKIIKLTADFNKLIYVIAFDDEIVSKALAKNYGTGDVTEGKNFLEKIVQLPLRIPFINNQERFDYTINLLNVWLDENKIQLPDKYQNDFVRQFKSLHDNFIRTPRDSKRLLNSISFSHQCLKNEVCLFDIILIETIRIFLPLVFNELMLFKYHLFSNPSEQNGYRVRNKEEDNIGKNFKDKIISYGEALGSIQGAIDFMFPSNNIFNVGKQNYRNEKQEDLFKYQRIGVQKYFDRFVEFKIGERDISDTEFKEIQNSFNTKDYSEIQTELNRLIEFPKEIIFTLFVHFKDQLGDHGRINVAKALCIMPHFFKDTTLESRIFHRPIRLTLELIEKLDTSSKIDTLNFIIENCQRINHAAFIIHECFRGYGTQKEFKFEPIADLEIISKEFVSEVQSLPIQDLFENVDDEKNDIIFNLIEKYGDILLLKNELKVFFEYESANGLSFMKSLIPMSYYNFSTVGEYGHEIGHNIFEYIESFVSREILKHSATKLFPEFENLDNVKPADPFEKRETDKNKEIINQYLLFISSSQNLTKQLAEATRQNS